MADHSNMIFDTISITLCSCFLFLLPLALICNKRNCPDVFRSTRQSETNDRVQALGANFLTCWQIKLMVAKNYFINSCTKHPQQPIMLSVYHPQLNPHHCHVFTASHQTDSEQKLNSVLGVVQRELRPFSVSYLRVCITAELLRINRD